MHSAIANLLHLLTEKFPLSVFDLKTLLFCIFAYTPTGIATSTHLFLLHLNFKRVGFLVVFASFVLEPDPDDPRRKASHLDELLLH